MENKDHFENKKNSFGTALEQWYDSEAYKEMMKENAKAKQRAIEKYHMLPEQDRIDMVEAITHIICKAESEGCSHRGLQHELEIYPGGFWVDNLMDVHNALWSYYKDKQKINELVNDLNESQNFIENQKEP